MSGELTPAGQGGGLSPSSRHPVVPSGGVGAGSWTPSPPRPPDDEVDLREVWAILRRNWWIVAGGTALGLLTAFAYVKLATPIYRSSTTLQFQEKGSTVPVLDALRDLQGGTEVGTEMEVLRSRSLAEAVIDSLGLQVGVAGPRGVRRGDVIASVQADADAPEVGIRLVRGADGRFTAELRDGEYDGELGAALPGEPLRLPGATVVLAPGAAELERVDLEVLPRPLAAERFGEALGVSRPNRDANVVKVRFDAPDPELARDVANVLAHQYLVRRNAVRKVSDRSTVDFLRSQVDTLQVQLRTAEDAVRRFREQNRVVSLEAEAQAQVERLAALQAQRAELESEREALAALLAEAGADAGGVGAGGTPYRRLLAFPTLLRNQTTSTLLAELTERETELGQLRVRRTPADPDVQAVASQLQALEEQATAVVTTYLGGLSNQVEAIDRELAGFGERLAAVPAKEVEYARLARSASVLADIYTLLQTRLKEAEVVEAVEDASVRVVDVAVVAREPVKPRGGLGLALGLLLGGFLGVAGALGRDAVGHRVNSESDVEQTTGLPVLVSVPRLSSRHGLFGKSGETKRLFAIEAGSEHRVLAAAEAVKALRSTLAFSTHGRAARVILVTSAGADEGKSTIGLNLAAALAQMGQRVLLVDGDLRVGELHKELGLQGSPGLADWLQMPDSGAPVIHPSAGGAGQLYLLPRGVPPLNPGELLGSDRMAGLLRQVSPEFDRVVIDSAPLGAVSDTLGLAASVDAAILVARAGTTRSDDLRRAAASLTAVGVSLLGVVLNAVDDSGASYGREDAKRYLLRGE